MSAPCGAEIKLKLTPKLTKIILINFELNFEQFLRVSGLTEIKGIMKKEYNKPAMRVVKMQQRVHILAGSPGGNDGKSMQMYNDAIDDENAVW